MHGYELRKRLTATLGTIRAFSFGSLYPTLRRLETAGHISTEDPVVDADAVPLSSRRSRVTYRITAEGKERLADLLGDTGPQSWSDDGFGVHLAFFSRTSAEARMRILGGSTAAGRGAARGSALGRRPRGSIGWTPTPPNCTNSAWSPPTVRSAGSTS